MAFEGLSEKLNSVFKGLRGKGRLTEEDIKLAMREVRMALLEADVNYKVAKDFCAQVSERAMGQEVMESLTPAQQVVKIVNEELTNLMGGNEPKYLRLKNKGQTVLMMCGLQGNGKTTHAAKLGKYYRSQGRRPLLVACDIYRPAAIEQLKVVGEQAGVPVFTLGTEKPEIIAQKALAYAKDHGNDIVILDTASGTITISGGTFDWQTANRFCMANTNKLILTGGTFKFNPSAEANKYVADGYIATADGENGTWTVSLNNAGGAEGENQSPSAPENGSEGGSVQTPAEGNAEGGAEGNSENNTENGFESET